MAKIERKTITREVKSTVEESVVQVEFSEAEARVLACFAFCQIGSGSSLLLPALNSIMNLYTAGDRPFEVFTSEEEEAIREDTKEYVGWAARLIAIREATDPLNTRIEELTAELGRTQEALREAQGPRSPMHKVLTSASWHAAAEAETVPEKVYWKVQARYSTEDRWIDLNPTNTSGGPHPAMMSYYSSRNAAYKAMRARAEAVYLPYTDYRVVPETQPEGVDTAPRGKYIIERWSTGAGEWVRSLGWCGKYDTAEIANSAIAPVRNNGLIRYRVKWVP